MKRDRDIASLFQNHKAKKLAASASPSLVPAAPVVLVVEEEVQEPVQVQERIIEEDVNPSLVASSVLSESIEIEDDILPLIPAPIPPPTEDVLPPQSPIYDINRLPRDPAERLPIASYPFNDQDAIRRSYILKGPFQPYAQEF